MDALQKTLWHPRFVPRQRRSSDNLSAPNAETAKLRPAQRIFVNNFSEGEGGGEKLFEGDPRERCLYRGCRALLSASNRYIYCRACLGRYSKDFTEKNPLLNLTHALEKLRRDRQPRKQARRKRA